MAHFQQFFVIAAIVALSGLQTESTLQCYSCEQFTDDPHCGDPFIENVPAVECTNSEVCLKQKSLSIAIKLNYPVFLRGCEPKRSCEKMERYSLHCSECSTDLCNSSTVAVPCLVVLCLLCFTMYFL